MAGMRDSDARWLERDVVPTLESLRGFLSSSGGMTWSHAALVNQLAETTAQVKHRLEGRQRPAGAVLGRMSRNPAVEHYSADVDGQRVPYIDILRWPCVWHEGGGAEQVYPEIVWDETIVGGTDEITAYSSEPKVIWDGDWCWTVTVDNRLSFDFECREDVEMVLPILAQGMAVAAGFTSHGPHSFPANHHGPAVGLAPFTDLEPATLAAKDPSG